MIGSPSIHVDYDYEEKFQDALKKITSNSLKQKLVAIKNLVVVRLNYEKQFKAEHYQLEAKYEKLYKPFYDKRAAVIKGDQTVTNEDIAEQLKNMQLKDTTESTEKGIPSFWLKCLKNSHQFKSQITTKDEKVLTYLSDITVDIQENGNFSITFKFDANDYFEHTELKREFVLDERLEINKINSTKIVWKSEELNPTIEKKKKNIKNKKTGAKKTVTKVEEVPSFFKFFEDYDVAKEKPKEEKEEDEEDEENDEGEIDDEYELGLFIKEELVPYAIEYYLGVVKEDDYDDCEEGCEDDEEDEEEEHGHKHRKK